MSLKATCLGLCFLFFCVCAGCQTPSKHGQQFEGFTNFGVVSDGFLYRGDAPKSDADITYLATKYGIRTIIDLRDGTGSDGNPKQEQEWVQRVNAGGKFKTIHWVNLPCDAFNPKAELECVRDFLKRKDLPEDQGGLVGPFFVHCQYGRDRTGLFIAACRIADGKDPTIAANEMRDYGQNFIVVPGLYNFVRRDAKAHVIRTDAIVATP
jgi:protein tyrosine/serine phosphatase